MKGCVRGLTSAYQHAGGSSTAAATSTHGEAPRPAARPQKAAAVGSGEVSIAAAHLAFVGGGRRRRGLADDGNGRPLSLLLIINVRFGTHPTRVLFLFKQREEKSHLQISEGITGNMVYPTCGV